ncbi:MAG: substrate-binding domain-containing protein [Leucothrix sp.]
MKSICLAILIMLMSTFSAYADAPAQKLLRMATTTSTDNTGLLKAILPVFEEKTGYEVQVVAVGTGKALKMGRDGDVDVVLVHARAAEDKFVSDGFGTKRYDVMHNEFVLIGPKDDPAGIKQAESATAALALIAKHQTKFISRGDDSGTHKKEQVLWDAAGATPQGKWYLEAGQGMGKIIQIAGELDAYTLSDCGTWIVYREKSPLTQLYKGGKSLFNPYGIIAVNPERHKDTNHEAANALIEWITSESGQKLIGDFRFHNEQLFVPNAGPTK